MVEARKAKESFRFYTRLHLSELTGLEASTLIQLMEFIQGAADSCIYHHTHRFLQQHQYLSPEPPNDFAYWVTDILGEDELGEKLASINTVEFADLSALREKIVQTMEDYLQTNPQAKLRFAREGEEFYFIKSVSFILPTNHVATDLNELVEILKKVTIDSIYFHVFESRLRLKRKTNDLSNWIETSLGDQGLADSISRLDPYTYTLDDLRKIIIKIIERKVAG
ncbi:MAG: DUF5752 family protein [Elusimicrobiota bacterium]